MDEKPSIAKKIAAFFIKFKVRIAAGALAAAIAVPVIGTQIGKPDDSHKNDEPDRRPGYEQIDPTYTPDFDPSYDPAIDIEPDEDLDEPDWGIDGDVAEPAKPDNDSTPSQPIPSENPEVEEKHQHVFGEWIDDGNQERRDCINGDHSEYRNHAITLVSEENIINYDGTYTVVKKYECSSCGKTITEKDIKNCVFGEWTYNNETKMDERVCKVTGYKETRTHTHVNGTLTSYDENYEYYECENGCGLEVRQGHNMTERVNSDGSTTRYCTNPGCGYSYTQQPTKPDPGPSVHEHSKYTKQTYPDTPIEEYCYVEDTLCDGCNDNFGSKKVPHDMVMTYDADTNTEHYECKNPKCSYSYDLAHEHSPKTEKKFVDDPAASEKCYDEIITCEKCGTVLSTTSHNHVMTYTTDENHNVTYSCTNPGCNYTYTVDHVHSTQKREEKPDSVTAEYCYKVEEYCTVCDKVISTELVKHEMTETEDPVTHNITHKCKNCDYQYVEEHQHTLSTKEVKPEQQTKDYCYETQQHCDVCGQDIGDKVQVPHDYTVEENPETHDKTYKCSKCGFSYVETHEHTNTATREVDAKEPTADLCYTVETYCVDCGKVIKSEPHGHTLSFDTFGDCTRCHNYTVAAPHSHTIIVETETATDDSYCYEKIERCSSCGEEISREKVGHNMDYSNPDSVFGRNYEFKCKNMGCSHYETYKKGEVPQPTGPAEGDEMETTPTEITPVEITPEQDQDNTETIVPPEVSEPPEGSSGEVVESSDEPKEPSIDEQLGEPEIIPSQPETPPTESDVIPSEPEVTPVEPNEDIPTESSPEQEIIPDNEPNPDNGLGEQIDKVEQEDLTSTVSNEEKPYVLTLHMD